MKQEYHKLLSTFAFDFNLRRYLEGLSVDTFQVYVNNELLPELAADERYQAAIRMYLKPDAAGKFTISRNTAYVWMHRAGAERMWFRQARLLHGEAVQSFPG